MIRIIIPTALRLRVGQTLSHSVRSAAAKATASSIHGRSHYSNTIQHRAQSTTTATSEESSTAAASSRLYMWGSDTSSSTSTNLLKQPNFLDTKVFSVPFAVEHPFSSPVQNVVCGAAETAFILEDGTCYVMGENKQGQLGLGHTNPVTEPTQLVLPSNLPIQQISLGPKFAAVVDQEGDLFTMGYGGSAMNGMGWLGHGDATAHHTPTLVESLVEDGCAVAQVQVSELHMTVLTTEGEVLSTGAGSYGRLGNFDSIDQLYLEPVEVLTEASGVTQLAGGKSFTLALTSEGVAYSWGRNHKGQLGTGLGLAVDIYAMQNIPEPIEADELLGRRVTKLSAGHSHAACITEQGELFLWGMGQHFDPIRVNELLHTKVVDVACGQDYTLVVDEEGRMYSFGVASAGMTGGTTGVLGQGSKVARLNQATLMEAFEAENVKVTQVSAGWKHAACLVEPRE